jgi:ubiquinone/menaquinone biosynthesis C-methylase UbiE
MPTEAGRARDDHDWHSLFYVDEWIAKDVGREDERRRLLDKMMSFAGFAADTPLRVLDIAAGYGAVTDAVMRAFPRAEVTLQDFSREMLDRAREHLSPRFPSCKYVRCDLTDPAWTEAVGQPYNLAVSAIGIHNLADFASICQCYRGVATVMTAGGSFLNCDYFVNTGGVELHRQGLREGGFSSAECLLQDGKRAIIRAIR